MNTESFEPCVPDEIYTSYQDVERGVKRYKKYFKDKIVFCNCDDPFESAFFQYFARNFKVLDLKELISISYSESPLAQRDLMLFYNGERFRHDAYRIKLTRDDMANLPGKVIELEDIKQYLPAARLCFMPLRLNGDYGNYECMPMLSQVDITVTHPPYSRLAHYITLMLNYQKKFLILAHTDILNHPKLAPAIKENLFAVAPRPCRFDKFTLYENWDFANGYPTGNPYTAKNIRWLTNLQPD